MKIAILGSAAQRAGVRRVVLSHDNAGDVRAMSAHLRRGIEILFVRTMADVVAHCLPDSRR